MSESTQRKLVRKIAEWLLEADEHTVRIVYAFVKRLLRKK